jgi:hypothetical protein
MHCHAAWRHSEFTADAGKALTTWPARHPEQRAVDQDLEQCGLVGVVVPPVAGVVTLDDRGSDPPPARSSREGGSPRIEEDVHEGPYRLVQGDRNRNARLAGLRMLVLPGNAMSALIWRAISRLWW